jgi:homoserine dehydrogenase
MNRVVGVGLAGFGTVGSGVFKHLTANGDVLERRTGCRFEVRKVAVRDTARPRAIMPPGGVLTGRVEDVVEDPAVEIVVELLGGIETPLRLVRSALERGKPVVTGNKALLAEHGGELFALAAERGVPIYYEAAVAGGIPIIKSVKEAFIGNRFTSIHGILNGTSNFILTRMQEGGLSYADALGEAVALGYAEADPTLDVSGWDAAHKAIILASLAYGFWLSPSDVLVQGIASLAREDVRFAGDLGYAIKLLATIKAAAGDAIEVRVCPTLIPLAHGLASVGGVLNSICVRGDVVGDAIFTGRGAGQDPTASSVLGDVAEAALALDRAPRCTGFTSHELYGRCLPQAETISKFYLRLSVEDRPGVLAQVAGSLASAGIGISAVIQPDTTDAGPVPLILMIHDAADGAVRRAVAEIERLDCVKARPVLLHVEPFA